MARHWLVKTDPSSYSIEDLRRDRRTHWDGVRNYQSRNFMRDEMKVGDRVLFYHSSAAPPGVAGLARVVREGYPDPSARDPKSRYHDPKASDEDPRWFMVDLEYVRRFDRVVPLAELRAQPGLETMPVTRGSRLSIQPVTPEEYEIVVRLAERD